MMSIKQFTSLPGIATSIKIVAASSLAMGVVAGFSAAPASAITFNSGELDFGVFTSPFANLVNPAPGNNFNVTFNPGGTASILFAGGSFSPTFTSNSIIGSNSPTVNFANSGGSMYTLTQDLVLNFAAATPTSFTLLANSTFMQTDTFINGLRVGTGLQLANSTGAFFTNAGEISSIPTLAFSFNDIGIPSGGLYIAQASPTAIPEPFTVIGTIIGGTAAFRMRKKLASSVKN